MTEHAEAFTVLEEMSTWLIFGAMGQAVAGLIERAADLSPAAARALADLGATAEQRIYRTALDRRPWEPETDRPVGPGLEAVADAVAGAGRRAGAGPDDQAWYRATAAAAAAVLAAGTPGVLTDRDRQTLAHRWTTVVG